LGCSLTTVPFGTSMSRLSIFGVFYFCLFSCECLACKSLIYCGEPRMKPICAPCL
jgi:hypothetical protein